MKARNYSLLVLLVLGLVACGRETTSMNIAATGSAYQCVVGTSFQSSDGCNTCVCRQDANGNSVAVCTQMYCN